MGERSWELEEKDEGRGKGELIKECERGKGRETERILREKIMREREKRESEEEKKTA